MQKLNKIQIATVAGGAHRCKCYFAHTTTSNRVLPADSTPAACEAYCCSDGINTGWSTMPAHLDERTSAPPRHHACQRAPRAIIPFLKLGAVSV